MEQVRVRLRVEGRVQGVFYRYETQQRAVQLGLRGWVRNLPDGSVECCAEGDREHVELFVAWCHHGPPMAHVDNLVTQWESYKGDIEGFTIR
jgi:acylphosphatase